MKGKTEYIVWDEPRIVRKDPKSCEGCFHASMRLAKGNRDVSFACGCHQRPRKGCPKYLSEADALERYREKERKAWKDAIRMMHGAGKD